MRKIAILGSTGSIGRQALDEIRRHRERFQVAALSAHRNAALLFEQIREFHAPAAVLTGAELPPVPHDLSFCRFYRQNELEKMAEECDADDALIAVIGVAGLGATLAARAKGKRILLANKETLVAGGALVMAACPDENGLPSLLPVDSEHSAVFQCLRGAEGNRLSKIFLTCSGGPFRTWTKEQMERATKAQALCHPTWSMGSKITVDSASMFNKALEIIEAKWLFNVEPEQIEVVVHPQSIVHSMVAFEDGAVLAQLGVPDMRVPILYAMTFPERIPSAVSTPDFAALGTLTFEKGDPDRFPALRLAYEALHAGGAACCILNAANEVAAEAFLNDKIPFGAIARTVRETLERVGHLPLTCLADVYAADERARRAARDYLSEEKFL